MNFDFSYESRSNDDLGFGGIPYKYKFQGEIKIGGRRRNSTVAEIIGSGWRSSVEMRRAKRPENASGRGDRRIERTDWRKGRWYCQDWMIGGGYPRNRRVRRQQLQSRSRNGQRAAAVAANAAIG